MRVRIYRAFASNNSGSYTLVGAFESVEKAAEIAEMLRAICNEHDAWHEATEDFDGDSPLDRFAREHGLSEARAGRVDEWPEYGGNGPPDVLALGHQVLLHVPYTVTMPRLFGELFYKYGGRVSLELDHAHAALIATFDFFTPDLRSNDPERTARSERFEAALAPRLSALLAEARMPRVAPVFFREKARGPLHLAVVLEDLVAGVSLVRELAAEHRIEIRLTLSEAPTGVADPLALLRASGSLESSASR